MNIVICDDEPIIRRQIRKYITAMDEDVHIREVSSAEDLLSETNMDLLFLDIQLEGMNGIEAARRLRKNGVKIPIIFVTALKDYIFDAFDVGAFQYLMKPIDKETFCYVYNKARQTAIENRMQKEKTLLFHTKKMSYSLRPNQILYAENDGKKIILHTINETIILYGTMQELECRLGSLFYRCHRGYLVNMDHIAGYKGDSIQMDNGESIYLARDKYSDFVRTYMEFLGEEFR